MTLPLSPLPNFQPSRQLASGIHLQDLQNLVASWASGKTATPGGGRATAYGINDAYTQFSVVATANDSAVLPKAFACLRCAIQNDGVASLQVFANGSDTIQGTAGATGVALAAGASAEYVCIVAGQWKRFVSA